MAPESADPGARQSDARDHARSGARRRGPTRWSAPGGRTIPTRSTTSSASPSSSAARSTSGATHDQRGDEARGGAAPSPSWRMSPALEASATGAAGRCSGRDYLIPNPFDQRLILRIAPAVARAAMETGVAKRPIADFDAYREQPQPLRLPLRPRDEADHRPGAGAGASASPSPTARRSACCAPRR